MNSTSFDRPNSQMSKYSYDGCENAAVVSDYEDDCSVDMSVLLQHHYEFNQIDDYSFSSSSSSLSSQASSPQMGVSNHNASTTRTSAASCESEHGEQQGERCLYNDKATNEFDMIEVADGVMLPLRGTNESLEAIYDGRVTIARCCCCRVNLHCIDEADLVICPDCYVVSPVDISDVKGDDFNLQSDQYNCVGLGFKTNAILARLEGC